MRKIKLLYFGNKRLYVFSLITTDSFLNALVLSFTEYSDPLFTLLKFVFREQNLKLQLFITIVRIWQT